MIEMTGWIGWEAMSKVVLQLCIVPEPLWCKWRSTRKAAIIHTMSFTKPTSQLLSPCDKIRFSLFGPHTCLCAPRLTWLVYLYIHPTSQPATSSGGHHSSFFISIHPVHLIRYNIYLFISLSQVHDQTMQYSTLYSFLVTLQYPPYWLLMLCTECETKSERSLAISANE